MKCKPGTDCTECPFRYEEETDTGIKSFCAKPELS